jgi:phosphohistidine phosphatase SixA
VKQLELRRHARRDPSTDALSPEGRDQAERLGSRATVPYDRIFVSPAARAAETAAWLLRGAGQQLPDHSVVPGLGGQDATGGSPDGMAEGVRALLGQIPDGGRGLAVSHTPFVEHAAQGLGVPVEPMRECEGILVTQHDDGTIEVVELRVSGDPG